MVAPPPHRCTHPTVAPTPPARPASLEGPARRLLAQERPGASKGAGSRPQSALEMSPPLFRATTGRDWLR